MKTLALEDIHADPHSLDRLLADGEPMGLLKNGQLVADVVPRASAPAFPTSDVAKPNFRARFLELWGADALGRKDDVSELFEELRRPSAL